jgi:hypothetical protein
MLPQGKLPRKPEDKRKTTITATILMYPANPQIQVANSRGTPSWIVEEVSFPTLS